MAAPTEVIAVASPSAANTYVVTETLVRQYRDSAWVNEQTVSAPNGFQSLFVASDGTAIAGRLNGDSHVKASGIWSIVVAAMQMHGIAGRSGTDAIAVGGPTIKSFNGAAWSPVEMLANRQFWGAHATATQTFASGWHLPNQDGMVYRNDGSGWAEMPLGLGLGPSTNLYSIYAASNTDVFAAGGNGLIVHYDGTAWSEQRLGGTSPLFGISGTSGSDTFVVGLGGLMFHYDGEAWSPVSHPAGPFTIRAVAARERFVLFGGLAGTFGLVRDAAW